MPAPKGNQYWQFRNKHGRGFKYTPEKLWNEFVEYMKWLEKEPLFEYKPFPYKGEVKIVKIPKMRAAKIEGFCLFADISKETFYKYKQNQDFVDVILRIEEGIRTQKFEGASAELLNPNIIARDLGLKDKAEIDHTSKGDKIQPSIVVKSLDQKEDIDKLLKKFESEEDDK